MVALAVADRQMIFSNPGQASFDIFRVDCPAQNGDSLVAGDEVTLTRVHSIVGTYVPAILLASPGFEI